MMKRPPISAISVLICLIPSKTERTIIEKNLNDQEIEYIVEYAIEPDYFMRYIYYEKFNIYHVEQYNHFIVLFPQFSIEDSITIVERLCLLNKANDEFYRLCESIDESWKNAIAFFDSNKVLVNKYLSYRNGEIKWKSDQLLGY